MKIVKSKKGKRFVCLKEYSPLVLWYILVNVWNVFIYCTDTQRHTLQNETHGFCWGKHPIVEDLYFIKRKTNILNISIQNFVVIIYFSSSFNFLFKNFQKSQFNDSVFQSFQLSIFAFYSFFSLNKDDKDEVVCCYKCCWIFLQTRENKTAWTWKIYAHNFYPKHKIKIMSFFKNH